MIGAPLSLAEARHTGGEGTDFGAPGKKSGQKYQKTTTRHTGRQEIDLGHQVMIGVLALSFDLFSILNGGDGSQNRIMAKRQRKLWRP